VFNLSEILDALEYDRRSHPTSSPILSSSGDAEESHADHTFKIVTTKRTLLLCAPSEEDEIKWLGAIRALLARRSGASASIVATVAPALESPASSGFASGQKTKTRRPSLTGGPTVLPPVDEGAQEIP
jgi:pleckstrin homology domain-containing family A member 1/2